MLPSGSAGIISLCGPWWRPRVFAIALLAGVPLGVQTASAGQQPEEVKANAVLAEARKALGGEDKLAAVKKLQVNGTTQRANGNFNLEGDTEIFLELPDKFRRNESLTLGGGGGGTGSIAQRFSTAASSRPKSAAATSAGADVVASAAGSQVRRCGRGWRRWQGRPVAGDSGASARFSAPQPSE